MDLLIPSTGLLFWMSLTFFVVLFILWKFGFPVITNMVKERQAFIDDSLRKAHEAHERLANADIRSQVAALSVEIAEKVLRANLKDDASQMEYINRMLDDVSAKN